MNSQNVVCGPLIQWERPTSGIWFYAVSATRLTMFSPHPYAAKKFLPRSQKGKASACVGGGQGGRGQKVETSVFKSPERSVPGRSNFEIRAPVLFYFIFYEKK